MNLPRRNKKDGLKIIIVGCGKVGQTLVEQLAREGHDITIIDNNPRALQDIDTENDVMTLQGNGGSLKTLMEAGLGKADMVIAVTGSDELNLLCCTLSKKAGSHIAAIARVRNPDYSEEMSYLRKQLGLAMIVNPDLEAAKRIVRLISRPQALTISTFAKGHAEMVRFCIPEGNVLCGKRIMDLEQIFGFGYLVCAIERNDEVHIPRGTHVLEAGDNITILTAAMDVHKVFSSIGMQMATMHSCMVVGGGRSSFYLGRLLLAQRMNVKIIEKNLARCEELNRLLPGALVIYGDGSDEKLLRQEGIDTAEAFVALTGIDEENILMTLYAQQIPGVKTITKINRISFNDVINGLKLGSVIYPKYIIAEEIVAYVRARVNSIGSNVETMYHLFNNRVEAIEFHIEKGAPVIGIPLMKLKMKDSLLIACINRGGKIFFPRGQDTIEAEDSVIIVTTHTGFGDISDILR